LHPANTAQPEHRTPMSGLTAYGWNPALFDDFTSLAGADHMPARVVRVDRRGVLAATASHVIRCLPGRTGTHSASASGPPATGDWIAVVAGPDGSWFVDAILPRRSAIARRTAAGDERQVLAANVDLVFVVHGLDRPPNLRRLERTLVMAWDSGATPVIVLTKTDLVAGGSDGPGVASVVADVQAIAPGVDVIAVSNKTGHGIAAIERRIESGTTVVLVGESGAGKSSLVNRLLGEERQATAETRQGDAKGRHTTASRELIPLPMGGVLIDTPGLRRLGLWEGGDGIALTFSDIEGFAATCRFRNCGHGDEPGCRVLAAVEAGELDDARLASYRKLQKELAHESLRADVRARRASERDDGRRYKRSQGDKAEW